MVDNCIEQHALVGNELLHRCTIPVSLIRSAPFYRSGKLQSDAYNDRDTSVVLCLCLIGHIGRGAIESTDKRCQSSSPNSFRPPMRKVAVHGNSIAEKTTNPTAERRTSESSTKPIYCLAQGRTKPTLP
eukprot:1189702-Prorocentrum_minimum.AAC.3